MKLRNTPHNTLLPASAEIPEPRNHTISEHHDIYVRAHTIQLEKQQHDGVREDSEPKWPDSALFFDVESRVTADQTPTFGFWRFCELRNNGYVCVEEGILHDDRLGAKELHVLGNFAQATTPETADDGCERLRLYSRSKFIEEVFGITIQANALIVCFNADSI